MKNKYGMVQFVKDNEGRVVEMKVLFETDDLAVIECALRALDNYAGLAPALLWPKPPTCKETRFTHQQWNRPSIILPSVLKPEENLAAQWVEEDDEKWRRAVEAERAAKLQTLRATLPFSKPSVVKPPELCPKDWAPCPFGRQLDPACPRDFSDCPLMAPITSGLAEPHFFDP